jgi:hypothetical protein
VDQNKGGKWIYGKDASDDEKGISKTQIILILLLLAMKAASHELLNVATCFGVLPKKLHVPLMALVSLFE